MEKVLISLPDELAVRMRATIPQRQRSKTITYLIEKEVTKREQLLYECAVSVEKDTALHKEMVDWEITFEDGIDNESW
jgi:hypothetical protein